MPYLPLRLRIFAVVGGLSALPVIALPLLRLATPAALWFLPVVLALAYILATLAADPAVALMNAAKRIHAGDLKARALLERNSDLGLIGTVLFGLADQLEQVTRTLEEQVGERTAATLVADSEDALRQKLSKGQLKAVVILPEGLSDGLGATTGPGTVDILFDASSQGSARAVASLQQLVGIADLAIRGTTPSLMVRAQELPEVASLNVIDFLLPGQLVSMLLSAGLITVAMSLSSQRQTGTLRHMFSTPLSVGTWMGARIAANLLMAALQTAVLYGVARAMFNVHMPANIGATLLVLALCSLVTVGMGLVVGVLIPGPDAAMPVAMILFMGSLFLGGSMMPLETGPAILQQIAHFVPSYYMTHALRLVMMQGKSLGAVAPDIAILAGCAAAGLGLAAWRMRRQFITA